MHQRFVQYLRAKKLSQRELSKLSCVNVATISRFCSGTPISSSNLLKMLQVCDDLSLEWFFYGSGDMIRFRGGVVNNYGTFAGTDMGKFNDISLKGSGNRFYMDKGLDSLMAAVAEKDRIIQEKDRVISDRDATIRDLLQRLVKS